MSEGFTNVQCPHCQNFRVSQEWFWYQPHKNIKVRKTPWRSLGYALITFAVPGAFLFTC